MFEVFLFLDSIVEVWISDPFDSSLHEGSEVEVEVEVPVEVGVETAEEVVGLGGRSCEQNHRAMRFQVLSVYQMGPYQVMLSPEI